MSKRYAALIVSLIVAAVLLAIFWLPLVNLVGTVLGFHVGGTATVH